MPESILSYNLTRKYPYPWFTWLCVFGGIAATAVFTVINLAADGYQSNVSYLTNPNLTEHPPHLQWFQKKPWSWASKVSSSCEDVNLAIGSEFYTNNTGLFYKLISISRSAGEQSNPAASLSYHNDALHDCAIANIAIFPFSTDDAFWDVQQGGQLGQVTAAINCTLYEGPDPVIVGLTTTFVFNLWGVYSVQAFGPVGSFDSATFLSTNSHTQAALLWGQALITFYTFLACSWCPSDEHNSCGNWSQFSAAYYSIEVNATTSPGETVIYPYVVLDNLGNSYVIFGNDAHNHQALILSSWSSHFGQEMLSQYPKYYNDDGDSFIPITNLSSNHGFQAVFMDGLVKSIYFTILTDLGQDGPSNALASPTQVMKFANETYKLFAYTHLGGYILTDSPVPAISSSWGSYKTTISDFYKSIGTGIPHVWPATINAQYLCQVPKLKPIGSMLVSVIVADLVFLQALWLIVTFLTTFFLERRHPQANYCDGCTKILASGHGEAIEMIPGPASKGNYSQVLDPDEGVVSPIIGSASASVRSGAVSARTGSIASVRRRNDANVQPLLASP